MKKSIVKTLSAFLVLALILSVLPMAAFAAEIEEHKHTDSCCADSNAVMPAMSSCGDGEHTYAVYYTTLYENCGGYHHYEEVIMYDCAYCLYSYYVPTGSSGNAVHSHTIKTVVGTDATTGETIYKYSCACGDFYYDN